MRLLILLELDLARQSQLLVVFWVVLFKDAYFRSRHIVVDLAGLFLRTTEILDLSSLVLRLRNLVVLLAILQLIISAADRLQHGQLQLVDRGVVPHAYLGVVAALIDDDLRHRLALDELLAARQLQVIATERSIGVLLHFQFDSFKYTNK